MPIKCFMVEPFGPEVVKSYGGGDVTGQNWRRLDDHSDVREAAENFGPGAMFYASWLEMEVDWFLKRESSGPMHRWPGPDGRVLAVITPGGTWIIDSRASNCTMPDDNRHSCWVRHGEPPNVTVDKNGVTCQAGAGSIQSGDYHGFLRGGVLTTG